MKCEQCSSPLGTPSKCPETKKRVVVRRDVPDSFVSWCVAFAAFMINFIMAGLSRMSGILYVAFIEMFNTDRKGASMPFSVRSSTMNLLGPVVGILGQKYGVRIVSITGGIVGTISAAACYFAEDITWITIIWGGLNGVGTALVTTLTTVITSQYFDKYKTTASGIAFSGACIGSFIFPPLMEELLHAYGLAGSFLIVAGIIMHCVPAAMILRKPVWVKRANRIKDIESERGKTEKSSTLNPLNNSVTDGLDLNYLRTNSELVVKLLTTDTAQKEDKVSVIYPPKEDILREMEDVYTFVGKTPVALRLSDVPAKVRIKIECATSPVSGRGRSFRPSRLTVEDTRTPIRKVLSTDESPKPLQCKPFIVSKLNELYNKNDNQVMSSLSDKTLYTKVLKELRKLHKVYEAVKRRNIFSSSKSSSFATPKIAPKVLIPDPKTPPVTNEIWDNIKNSVKLHTNPLFLLVALCRAVHFSTFIPVVTIIVDYTMDKGFDEEDGKYVIAALSVGDLLGRLCLGWVTDRGFISLQKYMLSVMIIQGICTASLPMMNTQITLLPTICVYALLQGSVFVRHAVLIAKYMKNDEQSIAMGCVNFFAGLLGFAVPTYIGFFRDTIGSYDYVFYLNGAIGALTGLLWIFEPFFVKMTSDPPPETSQNTNEKV